MPNRSWKHPELADHERPLNKRGQHDAPQIGTLLVDRELLPQLIFSSTAVRTRQTAEALVEASHYAGKVEYLDYSLHGGTARLPAKPCAPCRMIWSGCC